MTESNITPLSDTVRVNWFECETRLCILFYHCLGRTRHLHTKRCGFCHVTFRTVCINLWALPFIHMNIYCRYIYSLFFLSCAVPKQCLLTLLHLTIHLHRTNRIYAHKWVRFRIPNVSVSNSVANTRYCVVIFIYMYLVPIKLSSQMICASFNIHKLTHNDQWPDLIYSVHRHSTPQTFNRKRIIL